MEEFPRIKRLPPYVFNITAELKMAARRRGEDIIDIEHGQSRRAHAAAHRRQARRGRAARDTHGYSVSKGIPRLRKAICHWYRAATTSTSIPRPKPSSPSAPRKASPT
jgi:alanine-synthesizing transaminase